MPKFHVPTPLHVDFAPPIPGLHFRRFRGAKDYYTIAEVLEGSKDADQVERAATARNVSQEFLHMTNCDPFEDVLFAEVNGNAVGYGRVTWWQEVTGKRIYTHLGHVLPEWRNQGIGRTMLRLNETRLHEIASTHPNDGPRVLGSFVADSQKGQESLLQEENYVAVRHFFDMVRPTLDDIPHTPLPDGLEIRPVTPEHYRPIWNALEEAFTDHWGHTAPSENDYYAWLESPNFDASLWKVAWDGDQIAGMVINSINAKLNMSYARRRGNTDPVAVRAAWRRRGVARALLVASLHELKARGMTEAALSVDTDSRFRALHLYERLGYQKTKRTTAYQKPM
jgi:ribosomal protein S18 acetylase RimI-like enzyme